MRAQAGLSVVVPVSRGTENLHRTLAAVASQTVQPTDVVVVESGGASAEIRDRAAYFGATWITTAVSGASRARNAGLAAATGEVVAFTDDDAIPEPGWLAAIATEFADPRVAAVGGRVEPPDDLRGELLAIAAALGLTAFGRGERLELDRSNPLWLEVAAFGAMAVGPNMAFRRAALLEIGGFDERLGPGTPLGGGEEGYAFLSLVRRGHRVVRSPLPVVRHPVPAPSAAAIESYYRRGTAAMTGYPLFLLVAEPALRLRILGYALGRILGRGRPWRSGGAPASVFTAPIPLHARAAEYVRGAVRGLRTGIAPGHGAGSATMQ